MRNHEKEEMLRKRKLNGNCPCVLGEKNKK